MKYQITIIIILFITCSCSIQRRTHVKGYMSLTKFRGDTSAYIKTNFIDHKERYLGKPLQVFLNDWDLPIKSYLIGPGANLAIDYISISANTNNEINQMLGDDKKYKMVTAIWKTSLKDVELNKVIKQSQLAWTDEAKAYFGKQIITDLKLDDYLRK
ncbi:hypothetical protein ACFQ3S_17230 [Mucilaginibacter terrae]|uniref:hypothetical protein n=1 Tax=Mucilaginibacter terrae TaxID=1955052 RepID=UPI003625C522